jgi:hypothetical protein
MHEKGQGVSQVITETWPKKTISWREDETIYVSVPFTWELPHAFTLCLFWKEFGYMVRAGGPAVSLLPDYLAKVAELGGEVNALERHNSLATVTSRGCIRQCPFCAVDAQYRLSTIKRMKIRPFPMRYQPLDILKKNSYIAPGWTQKELGRFMQYWGRQKYYSAIPFEEFERGKKSIKEKGAEQ